MFSPLVYRGVDNLDLAGRVAAVIEEWRPDAVFIDSGAGVIDRLRQLGFHVIEVPFGGKATHPNLFVNRRSEMWWGVKDWLASGGAIPNDPALKQELATPSYWFDSAGRKVLEGKDEIKKRLLRAGSPDIADALALTFAQPLAPRLSLEEEILSRHQIHRQQKKYDMFDRVARFSRFAPPLIAPAVKPPPTPKPPPSPASVAAAASPCA